MSRESWTGEGRDESATDELGAVLVKALPLPAVVALHGTLAAGKTRLVQAMGHALGLDRSQVTSPTFVLVHEYPSEPPLFHFDAYRLRGEDEFWQLGAEEYLSGEAGGIVVIEWAERVAACLPPEHLAISLEPLGPTARRFTIRAHGDRYIQALVRLKSELLASSFR